jgi:8-oxo-dGTP pyrophosphatase MutT (NUDIX family)
MGDWTEFLVRTGKLTAEEAGLKEGQRDHGFMKPSDPTPRRETVSRPSNDRQGNFFNKFPSLFTKSGDFKGSTTVTTKWTSAGGVVVRGLTPELIDQVCLVKPNGTGYGKLVFPKGRVDADKNETKEHAATREVAEEAGVLARMVPDGYLGIFSGSHSNTHFYLMYRVQDSKFGHDKETEQVVWMPISEAFTELRRVSNYRDEQVLKKAVERIDEIKKQWAQKAKEAATPADPAQDSQK